MKLPDVIKVGPYDFVIEEWTPRMAAANERYGECSCQELTIRIDSSLVPIKMADTLLHELLHAVWWVWGIDDGDNEERTVHKLAIGLTAVWRDNPGLLDWFDAQTSDG